MVDWETFADLGETVYARKGQPWGGRWLPKLEPVRVRFNHWSLRVELWAKEESTRLGTFDAYTGEDSQYARLFGRL